MRHARVWCVKPGSGGVGLRLRLRTWRGTRCSPPRQPHIVYKGVTHWCSTHVLVGLAIAIKQHIPASPGPAPFAPPTPRVSPGLLLWRQGAEDVAGPRTFRLHHHPKGYMHITGGSAVVRQRHDVRVVAVQHVPSSGSLLLRRARLYCVRCIGVYGMYLVYWDNAGLQSVRRW